MWILRSNSETAGATCCLIAGKEYVVGRKDCSILVDNDRSISRKHATLQVVKSQENKSEVKLIDCSKFGVFVNNKKITGSCLINDGDEIMFGILGSKWKIEYKPPAVTSSCIKSNSDKRLLQETVSTLGGSFYSDWQDNCTHLVMDSLKMTVKAVCALTKAIPIVKPAYFHNLLKSIQSEETLPNVNNFVPLLEEDFLKNKTVDFTPCETRRTVFNDKTFFFISEKQLNRLKPAIQLGGGTSSLLSSLPEESVLLSDCNVIVTPPQAQSQKNSSTYFSNISKILQKHCRRSIHESEIGLAVVFNSVSQYCNPSYNYTSAIFGTMEIATQANDEMSQVLVEDSQLPSTSSSKAQKRGIDTQIIPELQNPDEPDEIPMTDNVSGESTSKKRLRKNSGDIFSTAAKVAKVEIEHDTVPFDGSIGCSASLFITNNKSQTTSRIEKHTETLLQSEQMETQVSQMDVLPETSNKRNEKVSSVVTVVKDNDHNDDGFSKIYSHRTIVAVTALMRKIIPPSRCTESQESAVNFKRFKKMQYQVRSAAPVAVSEAEFVYPLSDIHNFVWTREHTQANDQPSQQDPFG